MSDIILDEIRDKIKSLEIYRYNQKLIASRTQSMEMNPLMFKKYRELTGNSDPFIYERDNIIQIRIIEELGEEKSYPLYLETVSMLPGQRYKIDYTFGNSYFDVIWDFDDNKLNF